MLKDIAEGVRGSKGTISLGAADFAELEALVEQKGVEIEVDITRANGACIIKCEDLCNLVFGTAEVKVEAPEPPTKSVTLGSSAPEKKGKKVKAAVEETPAG